MKASWTEERKETRVLDFVSANYQEVVFCKVKKTLRWEKWDILEDISFLFRGEMR